MIRVVNEKNDERFTLEDCEIEHIIYAGSGQYGKEIYVLIFKKGSESYSWVTGSNTKSFADFKGEKGKKVSIQAKLWGNNVLSNVKRIDKKPEQEPSEETEITEE